MMRYLMSLVFVSNQMPLLLQLRLALIARWSGDFFAAVLPANDKEDGGAAGSRTYARPWALATAVGRQIADSYCAFQHVVSGPKPPTWGNLCFFPGDRIRDCCFDADKRRKKGHHSEPVTLGFQMSTFQMSTLMMMCLAVAGLRSIFSLPVSLKAGRLHWRSGALLSTVAPDAGAPADSGACRVHHDRCGPDWVVEDSFHVFVSIGQVERLIHVLGSRSRVYTSCDELLAIRAECFG